MQMKVTGHGARSVTVLLENVEGHADLSFSDVRTRLLERAQVARFRIALFLGTRYADAAATVRAIAEEGVMVTPVGTAPVEWYVCDGGVLRFTSSGVIAVRISLSSAPAS
jgi:hypothetical protein